MRERGYIALLAVLIVSAVSTAVGLTLLTVGTATQYEASISDRGAQARGLASACIEEALQVVHDNTTYTGSGNLSLGQGACTYDVTNTGGATRAIKASGTVNGTVRYVAASITIGTTISVTSWKDTTTGVVATPAFVQVASGTPQSSPTSVSATFGAQTAGNTNIIGVGFDNTTSNIVSVTDTAGNSYQLAAPMTRGTNLSHAMYYAKNITSSASNTVTVTFNAASGFPDLRIMEYSGLDTVNPLDTSASNIGLNNPSNSGNLTTTVATTLIVATGIIQNNFTGPGAGYTQRIITSPNGNIVEDRVVTSAGTYSATASASGNWVFQAVAFRAAGQ